MNVQLLLTKFHIPIWRATSVNRPSLVDQLSSGVSEGCKLTLVSAPAGYGKTTLISEWFNTIQKLGYGLGWLSLDKADNDQGRFLVYFLEAFQQAHPSLTR